MKKNKIFAILLTLPLFFVSAIDCSSNKKMLTKSLLDDDIQDYLTLVYATPSEISRELHNPENSPERNFEIALVTAQYPFLMDFPNKKNWVSNLFKNKNTVYINDLINKVINPKTQTSPLHLAIRIAAQYKYKQDTSLLPPANDIIASTIYKNKYKNMLQTIRFLLNENADINAQNKKGETALHLACQFGNYTLAHILLEKQANPTIVDETGKTAQEWLNNEKCKQYINEENFELLTNEFKQIKEKTATKKEKELDKTLQNTKNLQRYQKTTEETTEKIMTKGKNPDIRPILKNNIADPTNSELTEITSNSSSPQSLKSLKRGQRSVPSPADSLPSFKNKNKPRPVSAQNPSSRKVVPDNTPLFINQTVETQKQTIQTRTTIRPITSNSKAPKTIPNEYFESQAAAQSYMASSKTKSYTQKQTSSEVYAL